MKIECRAGLDESRRSGYNRREPPYPWLFPLCCSYRAVVACHLLSGLELTFKGHLPDAQINWERRAMNLQERTGSSHTSHDLRSELVSVSHRKMLPEYLKSLIIFLCRQSQTQRGAAQTGPKVRLGASPRTWRGQTCVISITKSVSTPTCRAESFFLISSLL